MLFFYLADLCGRRAASLAPLCKGSCRRSGLSGCFSLRLRTVMTLRDIPVFRSAYSASRNARAPAASRPPVGGGSFALPFLRTEPALRAAPVFRSAYFPQRVHSTLCSKTLDLQVRSAHPPMPHRNDPSGHSGVPLGLFGKPKRSSSSRFAAFGGRGELRSPLHPPLPPPRILERQTGTPFGLYSAKGASLPSQRLRGCPPSPPPSFVLS